VCGVIKLRLCDGVKGDRVKGGDPQRQALYIIVDAVGAKPFRKIHVQATTRAHRQE